MTLPNPLGLAAFFTPSSQEIFVIVILAFLLFGAKKIPELMRSLGRAQGEYQQAKKQFEKEVTGTDAATKTDSAEAASGDAAANKDAKANGH